MDRPETLEGYLIRSGLEYESVEEGLWIIHDEVDHIDNIVIRYSPPIVVFRVKLMEVPEDPEAQRALYRRLLELNATEMVAGAYGLEGNAVIASETLQSENLDYNEFEAAIDSLSLAISEHYELLRGFHQRADETATEEA